MCNDFVHLHTHSEYSLDGISSYEDLARAAVNNGQTALAITEHQNLGGIIEFTQVAKNFGVKPIIGNEFYVEFDGVVTHLTVLSDGLKGYNNLVRLLNSGVSRSLANGKDLKRHPVTRDDLFKYNEGLIVLSGCPASIFQVEKNPSEREAEKLLMSFKDVFGDRLFVEGMLSSDSEELMGRSLERSVNLSIGTKIPLVITNDVHFAEKHQRVAHDFFVRQVLGFSYPDSDLYLKSRSEMEAVLSTIKPHSSISLKDALDNTIKIADRLNPVTFSGKAQLPFIHDSVDKFKKAVWDGYTLHTTLAARSDDYNQKLKERLEYEMNVIISKGFETYMLLVQEFINVCRNNKFAYGKGRGSAAGSAVSFVLGITQINPLDYNLLFERFLNPERNAFPDIDLDVGEQGKEAIVKYASDKYGAVPIVTVMEYQHASLVRDMAKFYRVSDDLRDEILEYGEGCDAWNRVVKENSDWLTVYNTLLHKIRQKGKHAGGIVIDPPDTEYVMPLTTGTSGALAAYSEGGHGQDLAAAGNVKIDVLGLSTVTFVEKLEGMTGVKPPELEPDEYNDAFDLVINGELDGIFQLGGKAVSGYAMKFKPRSINDISLVTSLARKGGFDSGAADEYLQAREISGQVRVLALEPYDSGEMLTIEVNGVKTHVYDHWLIGLKDGDYKLAKDLDGSEDLLIES